MTKLTNDVVKETLSKMADGVDFKFKFSNGFGEYPDEMALIFIDETYREGYTCHINVSLDVCSGFWVANVNGFNAMDYISNKIELEFAVRHLMRYARFPCADEELYKQKSDCLSNESYY